jgi:ABC-type nitrate/sulfonate/bicarbonate transport system ATPase subunit
MLACQNISLSYGPEKILDSLGFRIESGSVLCLMGASGCGKTSLLKIISGLLHVKTGEINCDVARPGPLVGYMSQSMDLLPWLSAVKNAVLAAKLTDKVPAAAETEVRGLFEKFGLSECVEKKPYQLSGGQQQRVAILRTLLSRPKLLLLDEPFGHLDTSLRLLFADHIREYVRSAQATALIVTHQADEAVHIADRIIVIEGKPSRLAHDLPISSEDDRRQAMRLLQGYDFGTDSSRQKAEA